MGSVKRTEGLRQSPRAAMPSFAQSAAFPRSSDRSRCLGLSLFGPNSILDPDADTFRSPLRCVTRRHGIWMVKGPLSRTRAACGFKMTRAGGNSVSDFDPRSHQHRPPREQLEPRLSDQLFGVFASK